MILPACCPRAASGHATVAEQRDEIAAVHSITSSARRTHMAAIDLFVVPTIGFRLLYALVMVRLARRGQRIALTRSDRRNATQTRR
jgi:hypothetical protein